MANTLQRSLPPLPPELLQASADLALIPPSRAANCFKQLSRLHALLVAELELLKKIRYKQKNQHRSATWWRHLAGAQRVAVRFATELEGDVLRSAQAVKPDEKPHVKTAQIPRLVECCLRLLLLLDTSAPMVNKAFAAVEQLLRAALFMPLALTLKAILARISSLFRLFEGEIPTFLQVLDGSCRKSAEVTDAIRSTIRKQPKVLQAIYRKHGNREAAVLISQSASVNTSRLQSPAPATASRRHSPAAIVTAPASRPVVFDYIDKDPTSTVVPHKRHAEANQGPAVPSIITKPAAARVEQQAATGATESHGKAASTDQLQPAKKKIKKRKKTPQDDIDAIFGGL